MEIIPEKSTIVHVEIPRKLTESFADQEIINAAFHRGPSRRSGYKLTGWLLASVITDLVIIIGCTLAFLVGASLVFRFINNTELNQFMNSFLNQKALKETLLYLFAYTSFIYFIFLRVFLGFTVGEWSCGIRIGQPSDRMQSSYVFKIIFRVLLITFTGIFVLPLLSLIFKKDIAGQLTKASLYTLK